MEFTIPKSIRLSRVLPFVWAIYTILWQFGVILTHGTDQVGIIRMMYFSIKPLILAALIANGFGWARIWVGIIGIIEGVVCMVFGVFYIDELAGAVMFFGAVVYSGLSVVVLTTGRLD